MVALKVLPLLPVLLLGPLCRAKDAKGYDAENGLIAQLEAQVEALQKQNADLKKQRPHVYFDEEVPFVSTKVIVDSQRSVIGAFAKVLDFNNSVYTKGTAAASQAACAAAEMVQDLNKKHVEQYTKEYYNTVKDTYNTHLEPHVKIARKVYGERLAPHVDMVTDSIGSAGQEASKTFTTKLRQLWQQGVAGLLGGAGGAALAEKLAFLTESQSMTILNTTLTFRHGITDICLAVLEFACVLYVVGLLGKFLLRTFVWNIGVKFFGQAVCINLPAKLFKVSFSITQTSFKIVYTSVLTFFSLLLCAALGLGLFMLLRIISASA